MALCECGCERVTKLAPVTRAARGWVKGRPMRFVLGHGFSVRKSAIPAPPSGVCECGCGERTAIVAETNVRAGAYKGQPRRFVLGHRPRLKNPGHTVDPETGCWLWNGHVNPETGYPGMMQYEGRPVGAHVAHFLRAGGSIPPGHELDHLCRVRRCVNPAHLEAVTRPMNARRRPTTKLTPEVAACIRDAAVAAHGRRGAIASIARRLGVSRSLVSMVAAGKRWA